MLFIIIILYLAMYFDILLNLCVQWRFQDFFQGVASFLEMSSGGGDNLPGGGEKIAL